MYTDGATCNGHWMRAFPWTILISRTPRHGDAMDATMKMVMARGAGEGRGADGDGSKCGRPPTSGMLKLGGYLTKRAFYPLPVRHAMHIRESCCHPLKLRNEFFDLACVKSDVKQKPEILEIECQWNSVVVSAKQRLHNYYKILQSIKWKKLCNFIMF